jgi:NDP-sugar pyrophosphorylase family protein
MQAVILAGGKGRRLRPYTTVLPKPLMPIGDYPILEVILRQLDSSGFNDVIISTGYLHEIIRAYLESATDLNLNVRYSHEKEPLGTIAPLHLIEDLDDNFLVMNGDILTDLNYSHFMNYHKDKGGLGTVATYKRDVNIDFGVLKHDNSFRINEFIEKPTYHFEVSMGIYAFRKEMLEFVPKNEPFGFDNLMHSFIQNQSPVFSYPYDGYWLDIGRPDDYERSIEEFEKYKDKFLP